MAIACGLHCTAVKPAHQMTLTVASSLRRFLVMCWIPVAAFLAGGCTPLTLVNATVGTDDYRRVVDEAYGSETRQKLDIYIPSSKTENADVVIFFYGGRWQTGSKSDYRFVAAGLASEGLIAVIPDYRLYPEVDWREFIADAASAYRWVETHIASSGGNPRRIFLMGHSAGAHIAAMVALDETVRQRAGSGGKPCGMIGLAGAYDFLPFRDDDIQKIFGTATRPMDTQPIFYADGSDPSLLLLTGAADTTVKPRNSYRLAEAINTRGGKARVVSYDDVGHSGVLISLAHSLKFLAPTLQDTIDFVRTTVCDQSE